MTRLLRLTYARYLLASVGALGADLATFMVALALMPAALAAGVGYCAGMIAHWGLSSRAVFLGRLAESGAARRQQFMLFVGSGLAGLAITMGIVGIGDAAGIDPRLAKLAAIAVSFQVTYLLRRAVVFG